MAVASVRESVDAVAQRFSRHRHLCATQEILKYRLHSPPDLLRRRAAGEKPGAAGYPLILYLHGAAARGTDNDRQLTQHGSIAWACESAQDRHPCFVLAPQCPPDARWVDVDWTNGPCSRPPVARYMEHVMGLLDELLGVLAVDRKRVYVCGQSMGAFGVWDIISRIPGTFAAAVALAGGGDPTAAAICRSVPVWVAHGERDEIVPVSGSRTMVEALRATGASPRYKEYAGRGHDIWEDEWYHPELPAWLFTHHR